MNNALLDPVAETEFDYPIPCINENCDAPAVVLMSIAHSQNGCWSQPVFRCQAHYEAKRDEVAGYIKRRRVCRRCGGEVSGTLEQNMRVIPL